MLRSQPLSQRALAGLKAYEYSAGGYTWMDEAHQPFWTWAVNRMPMWLAPNLITLAGTLGIVVAWLLNVAYNPGFTGESPAWVQWMTALSVAAYVNLDCMDGKQARRTGSSSPLGQLFDHGCDALALHLMLANISAALGVGCGWKMAAGCMGVMLPWMLAQWEEYHTGTMMYGNGVFGVLEANYSICCVHVLSAVFGAKLWRTRIPLPGLLTRGLSAAAPHWAGLQWLQTGRPRSASLADVALVLVGLAGVLQAVTNVSRVFTSKTTLPPKKAGHKQLGRGAAVLHLLGLAAAMGLGAWSLACSGNVQTQQSLSSGGDAPGDAPAAEAEWSLVSCGANAACECRSGYSMFGLLYALTASQLILAHMAKEPWAPSLWALVCPAAHILASWSATAPGASPTLALVFLAALVYAQYVASSISQICEYLGISCLTIKAPPSGAQQSPRPRKA